MDFKDDQPCNKIKDNVHEHHDKNMCDDMMNRIKIIEINKIKRFLCPFDSCSRDFPSRYLARIHISSFHFLLKLYECSECNDGFSTPRQLNRHLKICHNQFITPIKCSEIDCNHFFTNNVSLYNHLYYYHRKKNKEHFFLSCDFCDRNNFTRHTSLEKHILTAHTKRTIDNQFFCVFDDCGIISKDYISLRKHLLLHKKPELNYVCDRHCCESKFIKYSDLLKHIKDKHSKEKLKCNLCPKSRLKFHMTTSHNNEKTFPNESQFSKSSIQYSGHSKIFTCPIPCCSKVLSSSFNIKQHIIHFHFKLKSYQCLACGVQFISPNSSGRHIKIKHNNQKKDIIKVNYLVEFIHSEGDIDKLWKAFKQADITHEVLNSSGYGIRLSDPDVVDRLSRVITSEIVITEKNQRKTKNILLKKKKKLLNEKECSNVLENNCVFQQENPLQNTTEHNNQLENNCVSQFNDPLKNINLETILVDSVSSGITTFKADTYEHFSLLLKNKN